MSDQPIAFIWRYADVADETTGEVELRLVMVPAKGYVKAAERQFGEPDTEHVLASYEERNMAMHRATFAELNNLYHNLPENVWYLTKPDGSFETHEDGERIIRFPTSEHFRKWLLIREGYCTEWYCECANPKAAVSTQRNLRMKIPHCWTKVDGSRVIVREAESQSTKSMGKDKFKDSMDAILARARSFVGATKGVSEKYARRTA